MLPKGLVKFGVKVDKWLTDRVKSARVGAKSLADIKAAPIHGLPITDAERIDALIAEVSDLRITAEWAVANAQRLVNYQHHWMSGRSWLAHFIRRVLRGRMHHVST